MRMDDLRTSLRELADEAEDLSTPDRLHGIDRITRRGKLRRRATGATAVVIALTAVGVGVSGFDPWRTDADEPVAQPASPPDGARIQTITDQGVRIEVDPGNARLIGHRVGWADAGSIEFEVTPTRGDWAFAYGCFVPPASSMPHTEDYMVELWINGVHDGSLGPCHRPAGETLYPYSGPDGDREARINTMQRRFDVQPGEPAQIELRLVDDKSGDTIADPNVLIAGGIYENVGEEYVDHGIRFESLQELPGPDANQYNYRLLDHEASPADDPLALEVHATSPQTMCATMWHGPEDQAATGQVTMEVVRPDGTTRAEGTFASGGDGSLDPCQDGDIVRLTPTSDVQPSKLSIAVYEPAG
jgi:hypothetical protein